MRTTYYIIIRSLHYFFYRIFYQNFEVETGEEEHFQRVDGK